MLYTSNTFVSYNYPLKEADVVFLGVPFASTSVSKPALYGPLVVRESLKLTEDYVNGRNVFAELKVCDLGDIEVVPGSYELTAQRIRETIKDIREANRKAFLIFAGGEHLITLPVVETLKPKSVVQLDAHADCRRDYLGNAHMHQTWAYHASKISEIMQIGVATWNKEEADFAGKSSRIKTIKSGRMPKLEQPAHLTIDMDVFAGVETGLPEGSMDICEIADYRLPSRTGFLAARLILEVLAQRIKG